MDLAEAKRWDAACKNPASDASHWTATPIKNALSWLIAEVERLQESLQDYQEVVESHRTNVRKMDIAMNGEERAAAQASLCDLVAQMPKVLTLSRAEGKSEGLEAAAKIVESECARVLALQTGKQDDLNRSIDQNVRMIAVLLPDIAAAIREAAQTKEGE